MVLAPKEVGVLRDVCEQSRAIIAGEIEADSANSFRVALKHVLFCDNIECASTASEAIRQSMAASRLGMGASAKVLELVQKLKPTLAAAGEGQLPMECQAAYKAVGEYVKDDGYDEDDDMAGLTHVLMCSKSCPRVAMAVKKFVAAVWQTVAKP